MVTHVNSLMNISELIHVKDLLDNHFLIIVSESRDKEMVARSRQLYPRLLSFSDENFGVVAAVINKQLARLKESETGSKDVCETLVQRFGS